MGIDDVWDADAERQRLVELFAQRYVAMLRTMHGLVGRALNLGPDEFRLDDSSVRRAILEAGARAVVVDTQTQKAIAAMLAEGQIRGLSTWEIANGTADFLGIEGLFKQTWKSRGETVARTELATAQRAASVNRYRESGLVQSVEVRDGGTNDSDAFCNGRDGQTYPLSNAPTLAHPNCTIVLVPVVNV